MRARFGGFGLGPRKPLLKRRRQRRVAVDLDALFLGTSAPHQEPVQALARTAKGDIGGLASRIRSALAVLCAPRPIAVARRTAPKEAGPPAPLRSDRNGAPHT